MKNKLKILLYMIIYDFVCEIVSLFIFGSAAGVPIGLIVGTLTVMLNFLVLERVVDWIIDGNHTVFAFLIHLGRFFIFGAAACLCWAVDFQALAAYGFGIAGFTATAVVTSIHELFRIPSSEFKTENKVCENKKEAVE